MTNKTRDTILQRLRHTQPSFDGQHQTVRIKNPEWPIKERIVQFKTMLESVRAEVHLAHPEGWTDTLKSLAKKKQLNNLLYAKKGPLGKTIEASWDNTEQTVLVNDERPIGEWKESLFFHIDAAVTSSRAAIAETGSLVLWPTEYEPRSWSLVPPVHFVVLDVNKLFNTFAEVVEHEQWQQGMPSNALLISGPSKSADIEQTLAYGVHGPTDLIVIVLT
ncbi:MAG: lactate utilization protein [Candidatus Thiodiazotropha sp. (ex Codakia rugifera)]|nr:lactate utilization protein [Candidatus Thiodiazotropha sp. (ex Codakia rugifera)]